MQYRSLMIGAALAVMSSVALAHTGSSPDGATSLIKAEPAHRMSGDHTRIADQIHAGMQPGIRIVPQPSPMPQPILPVQPLKPLQPAQPHLPKMPPIVEPPYYTNPGFKTPMPGPVRATPGISEQPISLAPVRDSK